MSPRILFVDDERDLLMGLRNLLRRHRDRWDMVFANSGEAALAALEQRNFDVVVSDIRMPAMDGPTLLRAVQDRHPDVARVVLSGHADRTTLLGVMGTAQVYLSKPCATGVLVATLDRCLAAREAVPSIEVRRIVGRIDRLPSPPRTRRQLAELVTSKASAEEMAAAICRDVGSSVKLLQIVNSGYVGSTEPIFSVGRAVTLLGLETVRDIVLLWDTSRAAWDGSEGRSTFDVASAAAATARLARRMAQGSRAKEEAFAAALVLDLGKLVLASAFPEPFERIAYRGSSDPVPLLVHERDAMGVAHTEVGGYLLGAWGLPMSLVSCAMNHHEPSTVPRSDVLTVVHVADALVHRALGRAREAPLDESLVRREGLATKMGEWEAMAYEEIGAMAGEFGKPSDPPVVPCIDRRAS